jgi:hypothetical protein
LFDQGNKKMKKGHGRKEGEKCGNKYIDIEKEERNAGNELSLGL